MVDIDGQLDQTGVRLEKAYWCADCNKKMKQTGPGVYTLRIPPLSRVVVFWCAQEPPDHK